MDLVTSLIKGEPAVIVGAVVSLLVLVAGKLGIIIDADLQEVLTPLIVGIVARFFVSPASTNGDPADEAPPVVVDEVPPVVVTPVTYSRKEQDIPPTTP